MIERKNIIFSGGYWTGRKVLINSLIRTERFNVNETTTEIESATWNGVKYTETPPVFRGKEITRNTEIVVDYVLQALSSTSNVSIFLIFVVLIEAGSAYDIRPDDVNSIKAVVRALDKVGVHTAGRFSILVNKVDPRSCKNRRQRNHVAMQISSTFSTNDIFVSANNISFMTNEKLYMNSPFLKCESWTAFITKAPKLTANIQNYNSVPSKAPMLTSVRHATTSSQQAFEHGSVPSSQFLAPQALNGNSDPLQNHQQAVHLGSRSPRYSTPSPSEWTTEPSAPPLSTSTQSTSYYKEVHNTIPNESSSSTTPIQHGRDFADATTSRPVSSTSTATTSYTVS